MCEKEGERERKREEERVCEKEGERELHARASIICGLEEAFLIHSFSQSVSMRSLVYNAFSYKCNILY